VFGVELSYSGVKSLTISIAVTLSALTTASKGIFWVKVADSGVPVLFAKIAAELKIFVEKMVVLVVVAMQTDPFEHHALCASVWLRDCP